MAGLEEETVKRGVLKMRVGGKLEGGSWENYLFALTESGFLTYRREQPKKGEPKKPQGLQLERRTEVVTGIPHESVYPFYVNAIEVDLYVAAETVEERDEWMRLIKEKSAGAETRVFTCIMGEFRFYKVYLDKFWWEKVNLEVDGIKI